MARPTHEGLDSLAGLALPSENHPGISYRLERLIGEGGMGVAFFGVRTSEEGASPVVVKVIKPSIVAQAGPTAGMLVRKEAVALGRLNERVPPTPFVVRFIDVGEIPRKGGASGLPWIAVEYVHGGVEGTTLEERVRTCTKNGGYAFDPGRAARAVRCIASGLAAIHDVGVIHRDLTPGNVLCCGFGEAETFKISDFGLAKPSGFRETFGDVFLGTPGFAAPEQAFPGDAQVGTYSDVYSLACLAFYTLTGERYFQVESLAQAIFTMREPGRRKLADTKFLSPELRAHPEACEAIDAILAKATALDPAQRPERAQQLSAALVPWLQNDAAIAVSSKRRRVESLSRIQSPFVVTGWTFTVRHPPGDDRVVRSADWDVDGHCLAATTRGLSYWNGTGWLEAPTDALPVPGGVRCVQRTDAGEWLVGGEGGALAIYSANGVREITRCPDASAEFEIANGKLDDLVIAVDQRPGRPPMLHAMAARRWMKPLPLPQAGAITAVTRLDDSRWLLCGRSDVHGGFVAIYSPMLWEVLPLPLPPTRAMLACQSQLERVTAVAAGTDGMTYKIGHGAPRAKIVPGGVNLSATAIDVLDRAWVAAAGRLWVEEPGTSEWRLIWENAAWHAPFVSIMADVGLVVAMGVDGAVLEGRAAWQPEQQRPSYPRMSSVGG